MGWKYLDTGLGGDILKLPSDQQAFCTASYEAARGFIVRGTGEQADLQWTLLVAHHKFQADNNVNWVRGQTNKDGERSFVFNPDGTISPAMATHLVLGLSDWNPEGLKYFTRPHSAEEIDDESHKYHGRFQLVMAMFPIVGILITTGISVLALLVRASCHALGLPLVDVSTGTGFSGAYNCKLGDIFVPENHPRCVNRGECDPEDYPDLAGSDPDSSAVMNVAGYLIVFTFGLLPYFLCCKGAGQKWVPIFHKYCALTFLLVGIFWFSFLFLSVILMKLGGLFRGILIPNMSIDFPNLFMSFGYDIRMPDLTLALTAKFFQIGVRWTILAFEIGIIPELLKKLNLVDMPADAKALKKAAMQIPKIVSQIQNACEGLASDDGVLAKQCSEDDEGKEVKLSTFLKVCPCR